MKKQWPHILFLCHHFPTKNPCKPSTPGLALIRKRERWNSNLFTRATHSETERIGKKKPHRYPTTVKSITLLWHFLFTISLKFKEGRLQGHACLFSSETTSLTSLSKSTGGGRLLFYFSLTTHWRTPPHHYTPLLRMAHLTKNIVPNVEGGTIFPLQKLSQEQFYMHGVVHAQWGFSPWN